MKEEIYYSIELNALRDFGNVFRSSFLRMYGYKIQTFTKVTKELIDGSDISKYTTNRDIILVYNYEPGSNKSLVFRFPGDGKVYIDKIIGTDESNKVSITVNCAIGGEATRRRVAHAVYKDLKVNILHMV